MEKLTVYIRRYITDEQNYLMFIECLEQANKHIINFDVQFIILCDNENIITKKYDPLILSKYNNIIFPIFQVFFTLILKYPDFYEIAVICS